MDYMKQWLPEQWAHRKFRLLIMVMFGLTLALGLEFCLFQYKVLKILRYFVLFWSLGIIAWIDQGSRRIPNSGLVVLMLIRAVILLAECLIYPEYWISILGSALLGLLLGGGMFFLCFLLTRGGIGAGDVKLFAVIGCYMGSGAIFTLIFLTILLAAFYSVIALALKKVSLKQEIAFAPFIFAGTVLTMMLGV